MQDADAMLLAQLMDGVCTVQSLYHTKICTRGTVEGRSLKVPQGVFWRRADGKQQTT